MRAIKRVGKVFNDATKPGPVLVNDMQTPLSSKRAVSLFLTKLLRNVFFLIPFMVSKDT